MIPDIYTKHGSYAASIWVLCSQYLVTATSKQSTQKHVRCTMTTTQNLGLIQPGFGKSYPYIGHTKNM